MLTPCRSLLQSYPGPWLSSNHPSLTNVAGLAAWSWRQRLPHGRLVNATSALFMRRRLIRWCRRWCCRRWCCPHLHSGSPACGDMKAINKAAPPVLPRDKATVHAQVAVCFSGAARRTMWRCQDARCALRCSVVNTHLDEVAGVPQLVPRLAAGALGHHQALVPRDGVDHACCACVCMAKTRK